MIRSSLESFREAALQIQSELFGMTSEQSIGDKVVQVILEKIRSNIVLILCPDPTNTFLGIRSIACGDSSFRQVLNPISFPLDSGIPLAHAPTPVAAFLEGRTISPERRGISSDAGTLDNPPELSLIGSLVAVPIFRVSPNPDEGEGESVLYGVMAFDLPPHQQYTDELRESVEQILKVLGTSLDRLEKRRKIVGFFEEGQNKNHPDEISAYLSRLHLEVVHFLRDSGGRESGDLFQSLADNLSFFLGYPLVWIGLIPPGKTTLRFLAIGGERRETLIGSRISIDPTLPEGRGLVGECATFGGPREGDLLSSDPRFFPWRERFKKAGLESSLVDQSVTARGERVFLALYRKNPGPFPKEIADLTSGLVQDLAAFLVHSRLRREREHLESSRKALRELQNELLSMDSPRMMFDSAVQIIARNTGLLGVLILEPDLRGDLAVISASCRLKDLELAARAIRLPRRGAEAQLDESLSGRVFLSGTPAGPVDSAECPEIRALVRRHPFLKSVRSAMAFPVGRPGGNEPLAVLFLLSDDPSTFNSEMAASFEEISVALYMGIDRLARVDELRRLSLVAQKTNDALLLLDTKGLIVWANASFEKKFGVSRERLFGHSPVDFLFEISEVGEKERFRISLLSEQSSDEIFRCRSVEGHQFWIKANSTSLTDSGGRKAGYVFVASDVSKLKEEEFRARVVSVFYRALSETIKGLEDLSEPVSAVLEELCDTLREILGATTVYLGRIPVGSKEVLRMAFSGPQEFLEAGNGSTRAFYPASAIVLETSLGSGDSQILQMEDFGIPEERRNPKRPVEVIGGLTAAFVRTGGERIILEALFPSEELLREEVAQVFQRIVSKVASYLDRQEERYHRSRVDSFRTALQLYSRKLLSAQSEEEVFSLLVRTFSERTDALAVDCLVPEGEFLVRRFLGGDLASVIVNLPERVPAVPPASGSVPTPTRAFFQNSPILVRNPASDLRMLDIYRTPPFESISLVAALPVPGARPEDRPLALVVLFFSEPSALDDLLLMELVGNILEHASRSIERLRLLHKMESLSVEDPLTGLLNRRGLGLFLPPLLATIRRRHERALLGILDLDDFKDVNDTFGHAAGDELLVAVGRRLQKGIRAEDIVARLGGDEFVVVIQLPANFEGAQEAVQAAMDRIGQLLSLPYSLPTVPTGARTVGFSLGLTVFPEDDAEPDGLLRHADEALYVSKRQKGNRSRWWSLWDGWPPPDKGI